MANLIPARFAGQAGKALALRVAWAGLSYFGLMLLSRWLTAVEFGELSFILSAVTFLGVASALGSQVTVIRYLGKYKASKDFAAMRGLFAYSRLAVLIFSASVAAIVVIFAALFAGRLGYSVLPLVLGAFLIPLFALNDLHSGLSRSFGAIITALGPRDVLWRGGIILIGLAVTSISFFQSEWRMSWFIGLSVVLLAALVAWQGTNVTAILPASVRQTKAANHRKEWNKTARPIWLAATAAVSFRTLDVVILGFVLPVSQLGYYFAASRTAALAGFVEQSINLISSPQISDALNEKRFDVLAKVTGISAAASFLSALCMTLVFVVLGEWILALFGPGLTGFQPILVLLAVGHAMSAFFGPAGLLLDMSGNERANTKIMLIVAILSTIGMLISGYYNGPIGTAIFAAGGIAVANIWRWAYARWVVGHDTSVLGIIAVLRS